MTFVEELLVLLIDEESGDLISIPSRTLNYALAGAVLLELGLAYRIDTDATALTVVDPMPLGDDLLDPVLADLAREITDRPEPATAEFWVRRLADGTDELRERATARLVEQGILEADGGGLLSLSAIVSRSRRYAVGSGEAEQEIHLRMMRILFGDELPGPRDAALISLVNACGVFQRILTPDEYEEAREKIDLYARFDRLGRAVANAITVVTVADSQAMRRAIIRQGGSWPKVPGLPLLGNGLQMRKGLVRFLTEQYHKHGPVFELEAFKRKFLIMAGPEANLFLLREGKNHLRSGDHWLDFHQELGAARSVVTLDGADHHQFRTAMRAGYSRGQFESSLADADAIVADAVDRLPVDRELPVFKTIQRIVSEQVGLVSGGMSSRDYFDDLRIFLEALLQAHMIRNKPPILMKMPWVRRARQRSFAFFEEVLAEHDPELRGDVERRDLIDDLLEMHRLNPNLMAETDMWFPVMGPFIVGMHTAAATTSYTLYNLLRHPETMARVQREADDLFAGGPLTSEGVHRLTDTLYSTQETMRLYPVVPGISRTVSNSFDFAGYRIPAGANLLIATPVTNRLPEYYPEPDRFDIDRFSPERRRQHTRPGIYAPFGLGSHSCLGQGFTLALMPLTIASILHRREIALASDNYRIQTRFTPLPRPDDRFKVRLRRRS